MTRNKNASLRLQSYLTEPYECSYLPDRQARSRVVIPAEMVDAAAYSQLIVQGFRRGGLFVYKPDCEGCKACVPIRVPVVHFRPSKSQRRIKRRLAHLQSKAFELSDTDEHFELYQRYQRARHAKRGMDEDERKQYSEFLGGSRVNTRMIEHREPETDNALRMVSVMDILEDGISSVYTFFEPDSHRSYGTYGILWQIEYAKTLGLPYVYLGYWIQECHKMSYKINFQPFEVLTSIGWQLPRIL